MAPRAHLARCALALVGALAAGACVVDVPLEGKQCAPDPPYCVHGYFCVDGICRSSATDGGTDAGSSPTIVATFFTEKDTAPPVRRDGVDWQAGDLVVVGYVSKTGNRPSDPIDGACTVGDAGATYRNHLYDYMPDIAYAYTFFWTYQPTTSATNQTVTIAAPDQQQALLMVWVVRGASSVLPAEAPPEFTVGSRAFTTGHEGGPGASPVRDLAVALTADAGTRPARDSLVLGLSGSFVHWSTLGALGASRTTLPGFTLDQEYATNDYTARAMAFHSTAPMDGASDVVAGTTSTDPAVYGNVIVLEIRR